MKPLMIVGALLGATSLAWATGGVAAEAPTRAWVHLPALETAVVEAMSDSGGGQARLDGDPGLGCFELRLGAAAPAASLAEVKTALEDGLREAGAVVSLAEGEGRTRFRLGELEGVTITTVDPAAKTARTVACLCKDRYRDEAERVCQRIHETSSR